MIRRIAFVAVGGMVLSALALFASVANGSHPARALTNCDTNEAGITPAEQELLDLINAARASVGSPSLKLSASLNRAAAWKSEDPTAIGADGYPFSHTDSLGRTPIVRGQDCGYGQMAENILFGRWSAQSAFDLWMTSPGHRQNILLPGYRVIGIGQHGSAWTTDFGYRDDSGDTPLPSATPSPTPSPTATPVPSAGIEVALSAGLNLVTYAGPGQSASSALRSIGGAAAYVYAWDTNEGRWLRYGPGLPAYVNSFETMDPGRVYYIGMRIPAIWTY